MGEEVADCATYEEVAAVLLHQMAAEFGVPRGDGRQTARGKAPNWEIEVNGSAVNGAMFLVVACRWHKTPHLSQAAMGGLAYRIEETGAQGGIVVRRLGVQDGAEHIAAAATMQTVHLDANHTGTDDLLTLFHQLRSVLAASASASEPMSVTQTADVARPP
jgi:hypothetical protein